MRTTELDHIAEFTRELLGTSLWLSDLAVELADAIPEEADLGEEAEAVIVEMVAGAIRTALAGTDPQRLLDAIEPMAMSRERVLEQLELALELSKRIYGDEAEAPRRAYG